MKSKQKNTYCSLCDKSFCNSYVLGRHNNEIHSGSEPAYACPEEDCSHRSRRAADLLKHRIAKHKVAKPSGPSKKTDNLLQTEYGKKLMAEAIAKALKRKRPNISSDEEDSPKVPKKTSTITSGEVYNPDCYVTNIPIDENIAMITHLPSLSSAIPTMTDTNMGTTLNLTEATDIVSIDHIPRTPSPVIVLDSDDDTPVKDELPTDQYYVPVTSPISPPEPLMKIPDYSKYAINSPERINAMSNLFNGSKSMLLDDLAISTDDDLDLSNKSNETTYSDTTVEYRIQSESNTPPLLTPGDIDSPTTTTPDSPQDNPTVPIRPAQPPIRAINFQTMENSDWESNYGDTESNYDNYSYGRYQGFTVLTRKTTVSQSTCYLQ